MASRILSLLLCLLLISTCAVVAQSCTPSVSQVAVNSTATQYFVTSCGFQSPSFEFTTTGDFETVSFNFQPFLRGPVTVTHGNLIAPIHSPQYSAVFGPGVYSIQMVNFGSETTWTTNVTVNRAAASFDVEDGDDDSAAEARRLHLTGTAISGVVFPSLDVDWYQLRIWEPTLVALNGSTIFSESNFFGVLFSVFTESGLASNSPLISSSPGIENIFFLQPGRYFIRVDAGILISSPINYRISARVSELSCSIPVSQCFA